MIGLWHSLISHWGTWTVSGITGFIGGMLASIIRWRWPSWRELQEEKQAKRDRETDARVMAMLDGIGNSTMFAVGISEKLGLDEQEVRNSLDRLLMRGRIGMGNATFKNPACWFSLHR